MTQVVKEQVTTEHLPRLFRNRTVEYSLMVIGAVVAALGAYSYFAPTDWLWGDLSEGWFLGSWIAGGALIAAGLGMLGASIRDRAGVWNTQATGSFVVATLALAGAVVAAVVLII